MAASIYNPSNSVQESHFLDIQANIFYLCFFDDSHSDRSVTVSHCGFDLHYLAVSDVEHLSKHLLAICISSWGYKM